MGTDNIILTGTPIPDFVEQVIKGLSPLLRAIVKEEMSESAKKDQEDKYISEKEARVILPVSAPTFRSYRNQGLFPSYRIGGRILYKHIEIIEAAKRINKYDRNKIVA
jgi:hypothetical protein